MGLETAVAIFVDYFDTLVCRNVTPMQVLVQWTDCMTKKYPQLSQEQIKRLPKLRLNVFAELRRQQIEQRNERTEVTYEEALGLVYEELFPEGSGVEKSDFLRFSREVDFSLECGCGFANERMIRKLKRFRQRGKKIYCVSDFYLGKAEMAQMMAAANVPRNLIDGIFVSCDCGKRKATGDLYPFVLNELGLKANQVMMIGDNRTSDVVRAKGSGLSAVYKPNLIHKIRTHFAEKLGADRSCRRLGKSIREMYRHGMDYSEYIGMFFLFTKRLYFRLREDGISTIAFMAREGFYLRRLFELYQGLAVPECERIESSYYWCSRRSVLSGIRSALMPEAVNGEISLRNWLKSLNLALDEARKYVPISEDEADAVSDLRNSVAYHRLMENPAFVERMERTIEENHRAFLAYTQPFLQDGRFCFVDSGWKCTTQNAIEGSYGIRTKGYYIGVQRPEQPILPLDTTALIFREENPRSRYYDYLGMNIPFYQQLLAAPHGSALQYVQRREGVEVLSEWDVMEQRLYEDHIKKLQEYMILKFRGLCAWDRSSPYDERDDWAVAKQSMKSSLFARKSRLQFIRNCTENYVQNFRQESRGKVKYDYKKARIGVDIFWQPEKYLRYFAKIQRTEMYDHKIIRVVYGPLAHVYYVYTLLLHTIKRVVENQEKWNVDQVKTLSRF